MPRKPRLDAPGALHHIIGRGIEKTKIYRSDSDRQDFIERLASLCRRGDLLVYAWALLPNHFHLLVRTGLAPIAKNMRKLLTGYVVNFNLRHKRYGHLFQNRYKSIICEDDPYLLELTRYIHLNPLRAGIIQDWEALKEYPWTGHAGIMGKRNRDWQENDLVLSYFGRSRKAARKKYEEFLKEGVPQGKRPELVGGGLIRSLGGWSQVLSARRKGEQIQADQRILGSGSFAENLLKEADGQEKETLRLSRPVKKLDLVMKDVVTKEGVNEAAIRSAGRKKEIVKGRRLFCQLAVKKMGYSGAQVARYLGITTSSANRLAASLEMEEVAKYF